MDGQEELRYDGIEGLVFSPDSQRVAYVAGRHGNHFVAVDGEEGSQFDDVVAAREGRGVIFDSPDQLHYMARRGNAFYLVEERFA